MLSPRAPRRSDVQGPLPIGGIDLSALKEAAEEFIAGIEVFGPTIYFAVLSRTGLTDLGELTPPDVHPETQEKLVVKPHTRVQIVFHNIMRLIREEHAAAIVYNNESSILNHLIPIVAMFGKVPFLGVGDHDLGAAFGHKRKKDLVKDIKTTNPLPGKEVSWPAYGAIAHALFGVKLRTAEARRSTGPEILKPADKTTESGLILPG